MTTDLKTAVDALDVVALEQANALAAGQMMPFPVAWAALVGEFVKRAKERSPDIIGEADGRLQRWRSRVRLYNAARMDEPEADSDPDLPADSSGATVLLGLPAVADDLAILASKYHKAACAGLDGDTLRHRLKSLRPTISRRHGNATWRVPYRVFVPRNTIQDGGEQEWLARVDVERVDP